MINSIKSGLERQISMTDIEPAPDTDHRVARTGNSVGGGLGGDSFGGISLLNERLIFLCSEIDDPLWGLPKRYLLLQQNRHDHRIITNEGKEIACFIHGLFPFLHIILLVFYLVPLGGSKRRLLPTSLAFLSTNYCFLTIAMRFSLLIIASVIIGAIQGCFPPLIADDGG